MMDMLYTHILLGESLCFSEGKTRILKKTETYKFLSSLALILNEDATSTAVSIDKVNKIVYIARNEPISATERRYFDRFFRQIRIYADLSCGNYREKTLDDACEQIESLVFEYNSKKILNRLIGGKSRTIDHLKAMIQWNNDEKALFIKEIRPNLSIYMQQPSFTEKYHLMKDNRTEEEYVDFLLNIVKRFLTYRDALIQNLPNPTDEQLKVPIDCALILYQSRIFNKMLNRFDLANIDGVNYFEKVTAHQRSIDLIVKCLLLRKNILGEIYSNITWETIPTVERQEKLTIAPKHAFESILTDVCPLMNDTAEMNRLYDQHCNNLKIFDENLSRSVHIHAEILLIDFLLEKRINHTIESNETEIGISKLPYFLCSTYIDFLNRKHHRCFHLPNCSNGKIYSKWSLRHGEDPTIVQSISEKILDKVKQSIKKISLESERSGTKRSGDSDVMATSLEEDEVDKKKYIKNNQRFDHLRLIDL